MLSFDVSNVAVSTKSGVFCCLDEISVRANNVGLSFDADFVETTKVTWFRRDSNVWRVKRQPTQCSRKTQDKFAIVFMAKNFLQRYIGTHVRVHVHFLRRACMHLNSCSEHHTCAGVYVKQVLWHQRTHLFTRSLQGVHMRSCMCSLFIQRWETRMGGFS